jgi:hypothetical protein
MNGLCGKYTDRADACFIRNGFVFDNFALSWTFLNIERCERDCSSFPERAYTQDNRRHISSDVFSEEKDVIGGIIKVYRRP